jgi:hypothetical protein
LAFVQKTSSTPSKVDRLAPFLSLLQTSFFPFVRAALSIRYRPAVPVVALFYSLLDSARGAAIIYFTFTFPFQELHTSPCCGNSCWGRLLRLRKSPRLHASQGGPRTSTRCWHVAEGGDQLMADANRCPLMTTLRSGLSAGIGRKFRWEARKTGPSLNHGQT